MNIEVIYLYCTITKQSPFHSIIKISGDAPNVDLMDLLPTELIQSVLFPYLTRKELKRISLNRRLEAIADTVMDERDTKCKYIFVCLRVPE